MLLVIKQGMEIRKLISIWITFERYLGKSNK